MLFTSLLVAASALSGLVAAQNETNKNLPPGINDCCTVDANLVDQAKKNAWCQAQRNTCPDLCGGIPELAKNGQDCNTETLEYTCECKNGTKPKMEDYEQSVPGQMCRFWFDLCIQATNENLEYQIECQTQRDAKCGNLTSKPTSESSSSASPSSTPTGTKGAEESASATDAAPSATATGAAAGLALARDYGTPLLVGGIAAVFGLAL